MILISKTWKRLNVQRKISYSTLITTSLLVLIFVGVAAYILRSVQSEAQWQKGVVLAAMTGENVKSFLQIDQTDSMVRGMESLSKEALHGFPGKAARILRKKYSSSLYPYALRLMTLILLLTPSITLVLSFQRQ